MAGSEKGQDANQDGDLQGAVSFGIGIQKGLGELGLEDGLGEDKIGAGFDFAVQVLDLLGDFRRAEVEGAANEKGGGLTDINAGMVDANVKILLDELSRLFETKVEVKRIRNGDRQTLETLINEEALLFAKYLINELSTWNPRNAFLKKPRLYSICRSLSQPHQKV